APPKTKKRNISAEQVNNIKKCAVEPESRAELARDLWGLYAVWLSKAPL
ncbi:MAG: hypothetical protein JWQ57_2322, partial [Mucilaginibacter sp.]|nr:hypothetical protein [Mucilaginibacter sp.]